jgi:hypothetical protein
MHPRNQVSRRFGDAATSRHLRDKRVWTGVQQSGAHKAIDRLEMCRLLEHLRLFPAKREQPHSAFLIEFSRKPRRQQFL